MDVALRGALPPGARPDLSVDGKIELEKLDDVVYVDRPVFGQQDSTVQLFKYDADGKLRRQDQGDVRPGFGEYYRRSNRD